MSKLKAMALVAIDALTDAALVARARVDFDERRKQGVVKGKA